VPENAQKWASIERQEDKRDYGTSDAMVEFLNEEQCPIEYHFLSGYHPDWIEEKSKEERAALQRRHMLETVERYKDSIDYFQVYNEFWRCPVSRAEAFVPSRGVLCGVDNGLSRSGVRCQRLLAIERAAAHGGRNVGSLSGPRLHRHSRPPTLGVCMSHPR
jgi:hypothetical protein